MTLGAILPKLRSAYRVSEHCCPLRNDLRAPQLPEVLMFTPPAPLYHRTIEWPGLKRTAMIIWFQPPPLCAGSPTTTPGCPEPRPAWTTCLQLQLNTCWEHSAVGWAELPP